MYHSLFCKFCHIVQNHINCMTEHTELINETMQNLGELRSDKSRWVTE